jgi:chaperone modulatory protein CbpM
MKEHFSEEEALARVVRLERRTLSALIEVEAIRPGQGAGGPVFTPTDIARLELLCDITEGYELDHEALGLVMTLIERLHATRADLQALARALDCEPAEVRRRVAGRLNPVVP